MNIYPKKLLIFFFFMFIYKLINKSPQMRNCSYCENDRNSSRFSLEYFKKSLKYYTNWSLILHILYAFNIIKSTYYVALFVLIVGNAIGFKNYFIDKNLPLEWFLALLISHSIPFYVIKFDKKPNNILCISLVIYFILNYKSVINCYQDIYGYNCNKKKHKS